MDAGEPVISVHTHSRQSGASSELGGGNGEGTGGEGTSHGLGTSGVVGGSGIISFGVSPSCSGPGGVNGGSTFGADLCAWVSTSFFVSNGFNGGILGGVKCCSPGSIACIGFQNNVGCHNIMELAFNACLKENLLSISCISIACANLLCSEKGFVSGSSLGRFACIIIEELEGICGEAKGTVGWGCEDFIGHF